MVTAQLGAVLRHIRSLAADPTRNEQSDGTLLRSFLSHHDQAAFEALVRRHGPMVLRVCRRTLGNVHDAEDALQATFLVLARQAASIRKRESLASWLHGVAYRMATHAKRAAARRHQHESQANLTQPRDPALSAAWKELQVLLDEEIQRLPEGLRAPFVLCCLENKSYAEAAQQLGLQEGTVRNRLGRARKRLQERLTRRGVPLTAVLAVIAIGPEAASAVSGSLVGSTATAATRLTAGQALTGGAVSANVLTLVEGVNRAMFLSKCKTAILLLVATALAGSGLGLAVLRGAGAAHAPPAQLAPQQAADERPKKERQQPADAIEVSGRVLDGDGKPLAGARLYLRTDPLDADPPVRATSDAEGRFHFKLAPSDRIDPQSKQPARVLEVLATAAGYGPDWTNLLDGKPAGELTFRLAKDDVSITGRVLDLDGKPVAGAKVSVRTVYAPEGDLTRVLREVRAGRPVYQQGVRRWGERFPGQPKTLTTNAEGRFRLTGIGRERLVELNITGAAIQHWFVMAMTRAGKDVGGERGEERIYGASFDYLARPSRPIVGTVRDRETGKPVAGVWVTGAGTLERVTTDAKGHYELRGCPKGATYQVMAAPADDQPYFNAHTMVGDQAGLGPITVDLLLTRGIPVRGKVTVKKTGKTVRGSVVYMPLYPNGNVRAGAPLATSDKRVEIRADGTFATVVLPGPGMLGVMAMNAEEYMPASVDTKPFYEEIFKKQGNTRGSRMVLQVQQGPGVFSGGIAQDSFQAIELINPDKAAEKLTRDLVLEPITRLPGTILGPDGQPLPGVRVRGLKQVGTWEPRLPTADFTVTGTSPDRLARNLDFVHEDKHLAASLGVKGDEKKLTVRMQPWATVTGQLVDADGKPWAGVELRGHSDAAPATELAIRYRTDKDGRFRAEGFVPGRKYNLSFTVIENGRWIGSGTVFEGLSFQPGQTKDLGKKVIKTSMPN